MLSRRRLVTVIFHYRWNVVNVCGRPKTERPKTQWF